MLWNAIWKSKSRQRFGSRLFVLQMLALITAVFCRISYQFMNFYDLQICQWPYCELSWQLLIQPIRYQCSCDYNLPSLVTFLWHSEQMNKMCWWSCCCRWLTHEQLADFLKIWFYFLMLLTINAKFLYEISIQWIFSQHCGYWWPGALAPGHQ